MLVSCALHRLPSQLSGWLGKILKLYPCTVSYIVLIILINNIFIYAPHISINGSLISSGDLIVGAVYVLRDFVQREIKHYVFSAMLLGCFLSYVLADKEIAVASVSAFFCRRID